jgi:hypothetical protein
MCARQVANTHEELAHDFSAGKPEILLEQLHPFRLGQRVMGLEPGVKSAVGFPQLENSLRVGDGRVHLQPIADDPRIVQQPLPILRLISGYDLRIEPVVRSTKRVPLLENGEPGKPA